MPSSLIDYTFVTICTDQRFPYFDEDIFAELCIDNLLYAARLKSFIVHGYKINPEHIHLILQKYGPYSVSKFLHSFKRPSSTQINQLICYRREGQRSKLQLDERMLAFQTRMVDEYGNNIGHEFPLFKWQKGCDVRDILDHKALKQIRHYLKIQHVKHQLSENKWLYLREEKI